MQGFGLRVSDGAAHAAADDADVLEAFQVGWDAQRADNVQQVLARFHSAQHLGGAANHLNDQGDGALFSVIVRDGQRHALALLIDAEDDKLSRENLFSDKRSFYLYEDNCFV